MHFTLIFILTSSINIYILTRKKIKNIKQKITTRFSKECWKDNIHGLQGNCNLFNPWANPHSITFSQPQWAKVLRYSIFMRSHFTSDYSELLTKTVFFFPPYRLLLCVKCQQQKQLLFMEWSHYGELVLHGFSLAKGGVQPGGLGLLLCWVSDFRFII